MLTCVLAVSSLCGVVLIARPVFVFGDLESHISDPYRGVLRVILSLGDAEAEATPAERLLAVG